MLNKPIKPTLSSLRFVRTAYEQRYKYDRDTSQM